MSEVRSGVDKVRAGEPFHMPDWDIVALMSKAKGLAHEFNTLFPVDAPRALELLKSLFGRIGNDSVVIPVLSVEFGFNIEIGEGTLVNMNCTLMDCFRITLGDRVQVAPSVLFFSGGHAVKASERRTRDPVTGRIPAPSPPAHRSRSGTKSGSAAARSSCPASSSDRAPRSGPAAWSRSLSRPTCSPPAIRAV